MPQKRIASTQYVFKVGDVVERITSNNGGAARIGQVAKVIGIERDGMLRVQYEGMRCGIENGEGWYACFAKPVQVDYDFAVAGKMLESIFETTRAVGDLRQLLFDEEITARAFSIAIDLAWKEFKTGVVARL